MVELLALTFHKSKESPLGPDPFMNAPPVFRMVNVQGPKPNPPFKGPKQHFPARFPDRRLSVGGIGEPDRRRW